MIEIEGVVLSLMHTGTGGWVAETQLRQHIGDEGGFRVLGIVKLRVTKEQALEMSSGDTVLRFVGE